jgi:hypothetical protein
MARWAGWGAGPAGAGAAGGPSKVFLGIALVAAVVAAVSLFRDGKTIEGGAAAAAAVYFALRLFGGLGRRRDGDQDAS